MKLTKAEIKAILKRHLPIIFAEDEECFIDDLLDCESAKKEVKG